MPSRARGRGGGPWPDQQAGGGLAPQDLPLGAFGLRGLADGRVCALARTPQRVRPCILWGRRAFALPHPGGVLCVSRRDHAPFPPVKVRIPLSSAGEAASFRHCQSWREFGRTGVRCEVGGLGWGVRKGRRPQSLPEGPCRVLAPPFLSAFPAPDPRSNSCYCFSSCSEACLPDFLK